jgi:hypothetical protein
MFKEAFDKIVVDTSFSTTKKYLSILFVKISHRI